MTQCMMKVSLTRTKECPGLGSKIKELRQKSSLSLTELAFTAGISVPHWNRIENEKVKELPLKTLRGIEKALNINLNITFE